MKFRDVEERTDHMIAACEVANTQTCGNCRHWAQTSFQASDPNWAACAWPFVIKPRHGDNEPTKIATGVEVNHLQMPRDGGSGCRTFLRDKSPEETPAINKRIP